MLMADYNKIHDEKDDFDEIKIQIPETAETGGKIEKIELYRLSKSKTIIKCILYIITCGFMYLLNLWFPKLYVKTTYKKATISQATHILTYGADKNIEIQKIIDEKTSVSESKTFFYRFFKYYYDSSAHMFKPAQFNISNVSFSSLRQTYQNGLDEKILNDHKIIFGENITKVPQKTCMKLFIENILSPFYIFQFYSVVSWILDNYLGYSLMIMGFSLISIGISIVETIRTNRKLYELSYYEVPIYVYRNVSGKTERMRVSSIELVPGDLFEVPDGLIIPCDSILLNGSCVMNESMLTGESIPVLKNPIPESNNIYSAKEDKQYTLFSGTKCVQARQSMGKPAMAIVALTGFATIKGDLIRTMIFPKETNFQFYYDSLKFVLILTLIAVVGNLKIRLISGTGIDCYSWIPLIQQGSDEVDVAYIFIKASQIITITVPPALPTCMQIGVSVALSKLKARGTYCITPSKINEAGRLDIMCFDKTGTLTEDGLDILEARAILKGDESSELKFGYPFSEFHGIQDAINPKDNTVELLEIMATCHSLAQVDEKVFGDPLDLKMFEATKCSMTEQEVKDNEALLFATIRDESVSKKREYGLIRRFEFTSKLQRMSVVCKTPGSKGYRLHIKGSPEKIKEMCIDHTLPKNYDEMLIAYANDGFRVIALATKQLSLEYEQIMASNREDIEKEFNFSGFLVLENKVKIQTQPTIEILKNAKIKAIMVTGDNILTAVNVARKCQIFPKNSKIFMGTLFKDNIVPKIFWKNVDESNEHDPKKLDLIAEEDISHENSYLAISGIEFYWLVNESSSGNIYADKTLQFVLEKCLVFARMKPDEKSSLVEKIQLKYGKKIIGMCGDGANDCAALKAANVGVSLSEAEASIAAPFTSKQQDISCIPNLLKEGRAALAVSYQIFKFMALYSMVQFISVTILFYDLIDMTNWAYYYEDIIAVIPFSFFMTLSATSDILTIEKPVRRLISAEIITSLIGQIFIQTGFQLGLYVGLKYYLDSDSTLPHCDDNWEYNYSCYQNSTLFFLSSFQIGFLALAYIAGRPFRKSFYTNLWFSFYLVLYLGTTCFILYNPIDTDWFNKQDISAHFTSFWENVIFIVSLVNGVVILIWERVIVRLVRKKYSVD